MPPGAPYDYVGALEGLQAKIAQLRSLQQQAAAATAPRSRLGAALGFLRQHRSSLLLVFAMYSMSTASVVAAIMAESRLQGDQLLEAQEQQQLRQQIARLDAQVAAQQLLLDGLRSEVQQHSSGGDWWRGADAWRQQALQRVHRLQDAQDVPPDEQRVGGPGSDAGAQQTNSGSDAAAAAAAEQQQELGLRVGRLGKGFMI